jgi:2-polyprenyl-3-methyl-5-hydroxy-6-metoxy-1,4-benzoquinol methylase
MRSIEVPMHIQDEEIKACPVCGSERSEFFCEGRDRLYHTTDQAFAYRRCMECQSVFQSLRPVEAEVWKCYSDSYGPHSMRGKANSFLRMPSMLNRCALKLADRITDYGNFNNWLRDVEKHLAKCGDILDFGCGSGKYMDRARKLGCRTLGVDFSDKALAEAARRGHETMPVSDAAWDALFARRLKFVRMNHVVEHLYQPQAVLAKIYDAMDEGGFLHISTPNPLGPSAQHYRDAWWGLECPRHIVLIPPAQLKAMVMHAGFSIVSIRQEPVAKDLLRSWAYKRVDQGRLKNIDIEGLAGDGVLNLVFSFPIIRHINRTGQADRYHLLAVKTGKNS